MTRTKLAAAQMGFDFFAPAPAPAEAPIDVLAVRMVATGIVASHDAYDRERTISTPTDMALDQPWSLPSRLFRHPIAYIGSHWRADGRSAILVRHPLLVDHPFVRQVAERLRHTPVWEPVDEFGRDFGAMPRWWHASSLMTATHWGDLLATRRFTDDAAIIAAVCHALSCAGPSAPSVEQAREVLLELDVPEPRDWSNASLLGRVLDPAHIVERHKRTGKVTRDEWAVNIMDRGPAGAWALVHGLEDGWFKRRPTGGLVMSAQGLRRRGLEGAACWSLERTFHRQRRSSRACCLAIRQQPTAA